MDLIIAYLAGLLTLINPCVLPVLPLVLASALSADARGPLALALGMSLSFVAFGMIITVFGRAIGLTPDGLSQIGALVMVGFGVILLVPALSGRFEVAMSGVSARADGVLMAKAAGGLAGQFVGGLLLGLVWSPCIGPTLGGAIALASQGQSLLWAFLIMLFFAAGVSTLILGIGVGGQHLIRSRANALRGIASRSKTVLGIVFCSVGLGIYFRVHHILEFYALQILPHWLIDLSVSL